jgi:hypothetical protein
MYTWQEKKININEDSKILIGLGDSFTQGHGACDIKVWEKYKWDDKKMYNEYFHDVVESGFENSWVNQLCKNHLKGFIPINFGLSGRGNRAAAKELYLHPELNIELAKEKIVVYMLTGYERFDFVNKDYEVGHHKFNTMWPTNDCGNDLRTVGNEYMNHVWSDRMGLIELLLNIAEVKNWCKVHNAKFILTSAFTPTINKQFMTDHIIGDLLYGKESHVEKLVNIIDWDEFFYPDGFRCITDYLLSLEERTDLINEFSSWNYYEYAYGHKKMTPNGYITKCAHPSDNGHKEIAKLLYEHIKSTI